MTARVMVLAKVDKQDAEAFEAAYEAVTRQVAHVAGHISDQLLREQEDAERYILMSEWESVEKFLAWEDDPVHRQMTTPMRPYWSVLERRIFEVARDGDTARAATGD